VNKIISLLLSAIIWLAACVAFQSEFHPAQKELSGANLTEIHHTLLSGAYSTIGHSVRLPIADFSQHHFVGIIHFLDFRARIPFNQAIRKEAEYAQTHQKQFLLIYPHHEFG